MVRSDQTEILRKNGRLLEVLHVSPSNRSKRKLPFHLHNVLICILLSSCVIIVASRKCFDLPMILQVWNEWIKAFPFDKRKFPEFPNRKHERNGKRPCFVVVCSFVLLKYRVFFCPDVGQKGTDYWSCL